MLVETSPPTKPDLVMKLITPAMASEPYTAEAPSLKISMRSMAEIGMLFKSYKVDWPLLGFA